ncbi:glycosyl transferase family 41-domain-containing protein [Morchella snyderi]|nr:glycosyl transferase family 41-domain-containing protein [Morchella snyderi]
MSSRPLSLYRGHSSPSLIPVPSQHTYQENLLRRKTPQGTLAAAYDATPIEWSTVRPTKQILLPIPQSNVQQQQYLQLDQSPRWQGVGTQGNQSWEGTLAPRGADINLGSGCMDPMIMWSTNCNNQVQMPVNDNLDPYVREFLVRQEQMHPIAADNIYAGGRPYGFQAYYNPIAPPTASCEDINAFMDIGHYNDVPRDSNFYGHYGAWGNGNPAQNQLPQAPIYQINSTYNPPQQIDNANTWQYQIPAVDSVSMPFPQHLTAQYGLSVPPAGTPEAQLQHLQLDTQSHGMMIPNRVNRDKVLAWAHGQHRPTEARAQSGDRSRVNNGPSKPGMYRHQSVQPQTNTWRPNGIHPQSSLGGQTPFPPVQHGMHDGFAPNREDGDRSKRMRPSPAQEQNHPRIGTSSSHSQLLFGNNDGYLRNDGVIIHDGSDDLVDNGNVESWNGDQYLAKKQPVDCYSVSPLHRVSSGIGGSGGPWPLNLSPHNGLGVMPNPSPISAVGLAGTALEMLNAYCAESGWTWLDGMLLGGCLAYGLGDLPRAMGWYFRILEADENHVEALSNLAATLLSLGRREEAERYWHRAVRKRPSYFEAVEHLVGLLCGAHRGKEAVDIINFVEVSLRRPGRFGVRNPSFSSSSSDESIQTASDIHFDYDEGDVSRFARTHNIMNYGLSEYMIPASENGRMLGLIHAKGNTLYQLGDNAGAARAFEQAILLGAGMQRGGVRGLINRILAVLKASIDGVVIPDNLVMSPVHGPVLLTPQAAVRTAQLVFQPSGELPGLRDISNPAAKRAAISTTSNSLLSLAKIFQDGMSSGSTLGAPRSTAEVKDILALYYLSLSLHPSPSTANNVGILLASVQPASPLIVAPPQHPQVPGIGAGVKLALDYYYYGLNLDSRHAHLYTNLGSLLKDINQLNAAIKMYEQAVTCDPKFDIALANLANAVKDQGRIGHAIVYYRRAVDVNPDFAEAVCGLANALNSVCDWKGRGEYLRPTVPANLTTPSAPTVLPFHTFTCPLSAKQVRQISQRNGLRISCSTLRAPWLPVHVYPPPAPPAPYLKIGYVSSDFNNHPLAHLMQSVFGLHNPSRAKAYCYATTASDNSDHRKQIEREAPVFRDAHTWGPDRLVRQIVDDGIHILINLNGFTRGARNEVFAARPAPIQMSFMGFAGTLGADWCDYIYADSTAVPARTLRPSRRNVDLEDDGHEGASEDNDDWVYSENIVFAKYTFFCCDHRQSAPDSKSRQLSWEEEQARRWAKRKELFPQLPPDAVILGNFNQLYKIEPTTFRTWLSILSRVPKAVLWLLRFPDLGETNLKDLAQEWAGEEVTSRIIFTDVAPKLQHISRAQVCDIFLDTPECNAHTTAADVLWSGTPLLTFPRHQYKMCSRIAASILRAAVPQTAEGKATANSLIVASEDEYEDRAVELANGLVYGEEGRGNGELNGVRKVLFEHRWKSALFDTKRWVSDLEDAYEEAWKRWVNAEGGDIYLDDLKRK